MVRGPGCATCRTAAQCPVGGASEARVWVGGGSPLRRPCSQTLAFGLMTTPSSGDLTLALEETLCGLQ